MALLHPPQTSSPSDPGGEQSLDFGQSLGSHALGNADGTNDLADHFEHLVARALIAAQHRRNRGKRSFLVEEEREKLFSHDRLEFLQADALFTFRANLPQHLERTLIDPGPGQADVYQAANRRLAQSARLQPGTKLRHAFLHQSESVRLDSWAPVRTVVRRAEAELELSAGGRAL